MRYIYIYSLLFSSLLAWSSATVTGNVTTLGATSPLSVVVRFTLQNCRSTPRLIGTGVIVSSVQDIKPDVTGNINGTIVRNDEITCVSANDSFYRVSIVSLQGGAQQPVKTMNLKVVTSTLDLNTAPTINNLTPSPFNPVNIITNPPTSQNIAQPQGTNTTFSGDGFPLREQGSTDAEHGIEIADSTGTHKWQLAQEATSGGQGSYNFLLKSVDTTAGTTDNYMVCQHDGDTPGSGTCNWLLGIMTASSASKIDFSGAESTNTIHAVASNPVTPCDAQKTLVIDQSGTGGQKLKICNAGGNGYDLIGDGGSSGAVTTFNTRVGDVLPVAGDYSTITETLSNKTIDSVSNTLITRSKIWWDAAGCGVSTGSLSLNTPATNGATASCAQGTINTQISFGILTYPDAATTVATGTYRLPSDYTGAGASVDIVLKWYQDSNVSDPVQNVRWNVAVTCVGDGENLDKVWNNGTAVTSATRAQFLNQSVAFAGLASTSCDAGDMLEFKLERLGSDAADSYTGSARLLGAELTLVRSQ